MSDSPYPCLHIQVAMLESPYSSLHVQVHVGVLIPCRCLYSMSVSVSSFLCLYVCVSILVWLQDLKLCFDVLFFLSVMQLGQVYLLAGFLFSSGLNCGEVQHSFGKKMKNIRRQQVFRRKENNFQIHNAPEFRRRASRLMSSFNSHVHAFTHTSNLLFTFCFWL